MQTVREKLNDLLKSSYNNIFLKEMSIKYPWLYNQEKQVKHLLEKVHGPLELTFESSISSDLTYANQLQIDQEHEKLAINDVQAIKNGVVPDIQMPIKTMPWAHQRAAYAVSTRLNASALLMDTGTGKSLDVVATAGRKFLDNEIKKLLLICTKSVIDVWPIEFKKHADYPYTILIAPQNPVNNIKDVLNVYVINYALAWRKVDVLLKWKPDMIVLDESQNIKNGRTKQAKTCIKLGDRTKYKMITTATLLSKNCLDGFWQYRFLNKDIFGSSITAFKRQYCEIDNYLGFERIVKYKNLEEYAGKLHSIAYRVIIDECTDMPESVDKIEYCYLEQSKKIYDQMKKDMLVQLESGEQATTLFVMSQYLRLQQITGGFLPVEDIKKVKSMACIGTEKLDLLTDLITDMPENKKIVIFARFRVEIDAIQIRLVALGREVVTLTGDTRDRKFVWYTQFQNNPRVTIIVAQIAAGGVGIELNAADTAIFYSTDFNYDSYKQARGRTRRANKLQKCVYIHLVAKDTIDEEVMKALEKKQDLATYIMDEMKTIGGKI